MAIYKTYANYLGEEVTFSQVGGLDNYEIDYMDNGTIVRKEYVRNKQVTSYEIYVSHKEEIAGVVAEYPDKDIVVVVKASLGDFTIDDLYHYINSVLDSKQKKLYDSRFNRICEQWIDLGTDLPEYGSTEKYLFIGDTTDFKLGFTYDDDGLVASVWGDMVDNTDQRVKGSIYGYNMITEYFPNLFLDYPYFLNAEFLP